MKRQYDYYETRWPYYEVKLYHDGIEVGTERKSLHTIDEYLERLENEGYTRGYTEEDVEKVRKHWEYIYENRIERNSRKEVF